MLKRLKDKLYYYFAEKNWGVRREYGPYVDAHQVEHAKTPWKHWWILIRLNWHYRILRKATRLLPPAKKPPAKKPPAKKVRLPYLKGSESMISKRRAVIFLVKDLLLDYDIVSFDIFDTLILRPFASPADLFWIIGNRLGIMNFRKIRVDAERDARAEAMVSNGNHEVTIYDIYKKVSRRTGIDIDVGVETELKAERDYCFANPYMKQVFNILIDQGKDIIITSDMYIPHDRMEELLHACGYSGYKKLYVSCDYSCNKRNGGLYKNIIKEFKGKKIVHIGDNYTTDIESANKQGLYTSFYRNCHNIGNPYRAEWMTDLIGSFYAGIVNTHLHNGTRTYNPYYEYGFIYGGLYIVGYCSWIYRKAKAEGVEKILFLSRDGEIYKKIFNMMFDDIPIEYVYWSRIANIKYSFEHTRDDFLTSICTHKAVSTIPCTFGEVLSGIGLEVLIPKLKEYKINSDSILSPERVKVFEDFLIANWNTCLEIFKDETEIVEHSFKRIIGDCKKVAVIDVGWLGTGPLGIKYLVEDKWKMDCEVKCYTVGSGRRGSMANLNEIMNNDLEAYVFSADYNRSLRDNQFKTNNGVNNIFFELFTQACYPSFAGLGNDISYKFDSPEVENYSVIRDIHKGIVDFSKRYIELAAKDKYLMNISGHDAYMPYRFVVKNMTLIKNIFINLCYSRNIGASMHKETMYDIFVKTKLIPGERK